MKLGNLSKTAAVSLVAASVAAVSVLPAQAAEKVRWKMQAAFGSQLSIIGETIKRFEGKVKTMSDGTLVLKHFEPGALVPTLEGFDAVKAGSLDAMFGTAGYHVGKIPALAWFTAVPFGPRAGEFLAWMNYGGGDDIYDAVYKEHGMKGLHCGLIAPESSGWFRKEINSLGEMKGLKMRFFGLGAKVMQKIGVSTQLLAAADIYPALERGVIDATEFSMPSIDFDLGFYQVAKHNYFPGWHQQASVEELLMGLDAFNGLSDKHKTILEVACGDSMNWTFIRGEAIQFGAMKKLQAKGVTMHRWPQNVLDELEKVWNEVVAEENAKDPLFKKAYESYTAFRKDYAIWGQMGYLK
jgi:TRAP-type mannitol/chloroaromatic compound transport system substrate-binding protein